MRSMTSRPDIAGMRKSSVTTSMEVERKISRASCPPLAVKTLYDGLKIMRRDSAGPRSSSTISSEPRSSIVNLASQNSGDKLVSMEDANAPRR